MTEFASLIPKKYCYLTYDNHENIKAKGTKMRVMKRET